MKTLTTALCVCLAWLAIGQELDGKSSTNHHFGIRIQQNFLTMSKVAGQLNREFNYFLPFNQKNNGFSSTDLEFSYFYQTNEKQRLELFGFVSLLPENGRVSSDNSGNYYHFEDPNVSPGFWGYDSDGTYISSRLGFGMQYGFAFKKDWFFKAGIAGQYINTDIHLNKIFVYQEETNGVKSNRIQKSAVRDYDLSSSFRVQASIQRRINWSLIENSFIGLQVSLGPTVQPSIYFSYEF